MEILSVENIKRWGSFILLGLLAMVLVFMITNPLLRSGYGTSSDEGYYYQYAIHIQEHGRNGFNELTHWYAQDLEAKKHPAPMRIGYILTCAFMFDHFGPDYIWMGLISLILFLAFLGVNFFYLRKHFGYNFAVCVIVILGTSPLLLGLSRRALPDVPVNFFWSISLWAMFEIVMLGVSRWRLGLIVASLTTAMLFKEATLFLAMVILAAGCVAAWLRKKPDIMVHVLWALAISALSYFGVMILTFGGIHGVLEGWGGVLSTHIALSVQNPYALYYCSGPWFRYLVDFFLLSPISVLLVTGYLFWFLVGTRDDRATVYWAGVLLLIYFLFNLPTHGKVVRLVSILEIPLAFFTAKATELVFSRKNGSFKVLLSYSLIAVLAILNFSSFLKVFYAPGLLDPISYLLLVIQGFIPQSGI